MAEQIETFGFFRKFRCESCTRCCRDWAVTLSGDEYQKLALLLAQVGRVEETTSALTQFEKGSVFAGRINMRPDRRCYFLQDDGFCEIQVKYGEAALPVVCRTFPRLISESQGASAKNTKLFYRRHAQRFEKFWKNQVRLALSLFPNSICPCIVLCLQLCRRKIF